MKKLIVPTVKLNEMFDFIWVQALMPSQRENMPLLGVEFWQHCWMALMRLLSPKYHHLGCAAQCQSVPNSGLHKYL